MLTTTLNEGDTFYGVLLFFSYPNGTDFYMNISPYVKNSDYYVNPKNLISYLLSIARIDNNIFGYTLIDEVKLISIPDEIIFYGDQYSNICLTNGARVTSNAILNEDKNLVRYDRNYTLDYQYMAKDQSGYNDMKNQAQQSSDETNNGGDFCYQQKTYYGRVNRLTFRLFPLLL